MSYMPATTIDHGGLVGLGDDDHPQYVKDAGDTVTGPIIIDSNTRPGLMLQGVTGAGPGLRPELRMKKTDGGTDAKEWMWYVAGAASEALPDGGALALISVLDNGTVGSNPAYRFFRDGRLRLGKDPADVLDSATKQYVDANFLDQRKTSYCATMQDVFADTVLTLSSGTVYGVMAISETTQSFTNITFLTGSPAPSAVTDLKLCVWDSAGVLLRATANISGTATAASTLYNAALTSAVSLTKGQQVYMGVAWVGTTLNVRGVSLVAGVAGARGLRTAALSRQSTSWGGGTPPALGAGSTGFLPFVELS